MRSSTASLGARARKTLPHIPQRSARKVCGEVRSSKSSVKAAGSDGWSPQTLQKAGTSGNSVSPAGGRAGTVVGATLSDWLIGGATDGSARVGVTVTWLPTET
jgi:hypothetical protein